jgi:hypothetical protein
MWVVTWDPELGGRQHHRHLVGAGQLGQEFGVAGILVAGGVQGLLVQRRGADGVDLASDGQLGCSFDETVGAHAGCGRQLAERQVRRDAVQVQAVDDTGTKGRLPRAGHRPHLQVHAGDLQGPAQPAGIPDN